MEIQSDIKYFKDCSIFNCLSCDFGFVNPMPKADDLNFFYNNIYRSPGRPPFWCTKDISEIDLETISDKNLNYLLYITSLIDFKKINSILDFGAGYGDIGYLLKKNFLTSNYIPVKMINIAKIFYLREILRILKV